MRKKRILFVTEFSALNSGFAVYGKNLITALFDKDKYEIASLAAYCKPGDSRIWDLPWKVFPVIPHPSDQEATAIYNSNRANQFGAACFDKVALEWKADIVIDWRDPWYFSYQPNSPYRRFFKHIVMPAIDSYPQRDEWMDIYKRVDRVLTYSHFGKEVIEDQSNGSINVAGVAQAGVELDLFKPTEDKRKLREELGIDPNLKIVSFVSRNQMRKLFPDFLETMGIFVEKYKDKNPELAKNLVFYLHTSYPDNGWDIPECIMRSGYSHKVMMTYVCSKCGHVFASYFSGMQARCRRCKQMTAILPNINCGVSREHLAKIMQCADLAVQLATAGGQEMAIAEFKACGVPVIAPPYSAMEEQVVDIGNEERRHRGGIPVKIERFFTEQQSMLYRCLFSREDLADKIYDTLTMPKKEHDTLCREARECAEEIYNWKNSIETWEKIIDEIEVDPVGETWESPISIIKPKADQAPHTNSAEEFVDWCHDNFLNNDDIITDYQKSRMVLSLKAGYNVDKKKPDEKVTPEGMIERFRGIMNLKNESERYRDVVLNGSKKVNNFKIEIIS